MMRLACCIGGRQPSRYAIDTAGPALMDEMGLKQVHPRVPSTLAANVLGTRPRQTSVTKICGTA